MHIKYIVQFKKKQANTLYTNQQAWEIFTYKNLKPPMSIVIEKICGVTKTNDKWFSLCSTRKWTTGKLIIMWSDCIPGNRQVQFLLFPKEILWAILAFCKEWLITQISNLYWVQIYKYKISLKLIFGGSTMSIIYLRANILYIYFKYLTFYAEVLILLLLILSSKFTTSLTVQHLSLQITKSCSSLPINTNNRECDLSCGLLQCLQLQSTL